MTRLSPNRVVVLAPVLAFIVLFVVELALVLRTNGGRFVYTLDDPYIHLALAEGITHGTYGLNPGEASAPSSSVAWPFLLAAFGAAEWAPLALNVFLSIGIAIVLGRLVLAAIPEVSGARLNAFRAALACLLLPTMNVVGLAFSGMEHSAHILLTLLLALGLWSEAQTGRIPRWLPFVLVAGPLFRYEALAFSIPAIVVLVWRGHSRPAIASAFVIALALGAFSFFLHAQGLGFIPTSVLLKSQPLSAGSLPSFVFNAHLNLATRQGAALALLAVAVVPACFGAARTRAVRAYAAWAITGVVLHLFFGRFGWYNRYEIYAFATALAAVLLIHGSALASFAAHAPRAAFAFVTASLLMLAYPYWSVLRTLPVAASDIHQQHEQMHRFATEVWKAPVAVNDLGFVAYRNDAYVLDLWGLGSKRALEHRRRPREGPEWMNDLAREHEVRLAMIYPEWFKKLPENWQPLADLELGHPSVSATRSVVRFYAFDDEARAQALPLLEEFQATLPKGAKLTMPVAEGGDASESKSSAEDAPSESTAEGTSPDVAPESAPPTS